MEGQGETGDQGEGDDDDDMGNIVVSSACESLDIHNA